MFEILETQICCFSRNTHSKFFPKSSVSGDHLDGRSSRALFAMGMFSWYKILNFRKIYLSVLKIFRHKIFSKIICIRRTARQLVLSCHIFHERFLLIQLSTRQICCFSRYTHTIFLRKSSVPGEPLDRVSRRATFSMDMFFWYNVRNISQTDHLFLQINPLNVFSIIVSIRSSGRNVSSCPLYHGHVLLIQDFNIQEDKHICSQDIPNQIFFGKRLYQQNCSTSVLVVPPLPLTCSSDSLFELSARQICCFSRYTQSIFLRNWYQENR